MKIISVLNTLSFLLLLTGCAASVTPHYYTLVSAANNNPPRTVAAAPFVIRMHQVTIPEQLNQPQLVIRTGKGEIVMSDNALWASPLPEEMRNALTGQLERSLNTLEITGLTPPQDKPVVGISVTVQQFDAWPDNYASIALTWRLSVDVGSAQERILTCRTQRTYTTRGDYPALINTQQALMRDVAADIAKSIRQYQCA